MAISQDQPMPNGTLASEGAPAAAKTTNGYLSHAVPSFNSHSIPLNDETAYTPRRLRVVTIGAGFSGLMLAHKLQHRFPEMQDMVSHTIFEARGDLGGTWLVNTYPGVQCDVPSHIYVRGALQFLSESLHLFFSAVICIMKRKGLMDINLEGFSV